MTSGADSWIATFGIYTPTLRPPTIVPEQVRLLRSILVERGDIEVALLQAKEFLDA